MWNITTPMKVRISVNADTRQDVRKRHFMWQIYNIKLAKLKTCVIKNKCVAYT